MNKNILKVTFLLGTLAVSSAGIVALLSDEDKRKKIKETTDQLSKRANKMMEDIEEDYQEFDKNIERYKKSKDYKQKVEQVGTASKEIIKQLEILRKNSTELIKAFKDASEKR